MKGKYDRLFDELEQVGKDSIQSDSHSGWEARLNDSFAIAYDEPLVIPSEYRPARRTEGVKAGHRVVVSFRSEDSQGV